ncbi:uncharacterized protein LOC143210246 isoform X2 [Lasioglossum baleicum]|uniref:uncharacterized protein LOC143210246 isoform X2 n=1 Tax=Lasioglossum baleicum TaxID=434251 RepID=UPI003FCCCFD0
MLRQFCFAKITVVSPLLLALSDLFLVNCCVGMCLDALLGENLEEIRGRLKSKAASGGFVLSYTKSTLFSGAGECISQSAEDKNPQYLYRNVSIFKLS